MMFQHLQFVTDHCVLVDTDDLKGRTITGVINVRKDLSKCWCEC